MNLGTFSNVNAAILQVFVRWGFFFLFCFSCFGFIHFIRQGKHEGVSQDDLWSSGPRPSGSVDL